MKCWHVIPKKLKLSRLIGDPRSIILCKRKFNHAGPHESALYTWNQGGKYARRKS